jgi:hypothetical protein
MPLGIDQVAVTHLVCLGRTMKWKEISSCKAHTSVTSGGTIRRAVDSFIGENLIAAGLRRPTPIEKTHIQYYARVRSTRE